MPDIWIDPSDPSRVVIGKTVSTAYAIIDPQTNLVQDAIVADAEFVAHYKTLIADPNVDTPGLTPQHLFVDITHLVPRVLIGSPLPSV